MSYPIEDRIDHPEIQAPPTERLVPETERTLRLVRSSIPSRTWATICS